MIRKNTTTLFFCFLLWSTATLGLGIEGQYITVKRHPENPLITFKSSISLGNNINGPTVIKSPPWLQSPLGKYYMYFAHHHGKFIRLAYANTLQGPWMIHEPGTLRLKQTKAFKSHIASPDVHVDAEKKEIRMYFHGRAKSQKGQKTGVAVSKDGVTFAASTATIGPAYFRVFRWGGYFYAIDGHGRLHRSSYPDRDWYKRDIKLFSHVTVDDSYGRRTNVRIRHPAVLVRNNTLYLFYTRKGDAPERIFASTVALHDDWNQWKASKPVEVMRPQMVYEGNQYPISPSKKGKAIKVCQLRDPYVFEENGALYLFYTISGEMGIAMAEIAINDRGVQSATKVTGD